METFNIRYTSNDESSSEKSSNFKDSNFNVQSVEDDDKEVSRGRKRKNYA